MDEKPPQALETWLARLRDRWFGDEPEEAPAPDAPPLEVESFEELCDILLEGCRSERAQAAVALTHYGPAAVAPLAVALRGPSQPAACAAAASLGAIGGRAALDALVEALEGRQLEVRCAAAEALGEMGDAGAVQPLLTTLRRCFRGGSARYQRYIGVTAVVILVLAALGLATGIAALKAFGAAWGIINLGLTGVNGYLKRSRANSPLVRAITGALARIAEQNPTPELSAAVVDLQAVAADAVHQDRETRATSREAAEKIEALTERIKNLPLIASPPERGTADLPLPAQPAEPTAEELPRVQC